MGLSNLMTFHWKQKFMVLYRIGRADKIVVDGVIVLCDQPYLFIHKIK